MIKIVAMGDSTTAGTPGFMSPIEAPPDGEGNVESQYAFWLMKEHGDWKVLNKGVNGERTDQILARFQRDVVAEKPKIVVVLGGVNDIYQGLPAEHAEQSLSRMYSSALRAAIVPIACTVLPYNTMGSREGSVRRELNGWVKSESSKRGIPLCDTAAVTSDPRNSDRLAGSPDGLHPGVLGYRRMAGAISSVIVAFLAGEQGSR